MKSISDNQKFFEEIRESNNILQSVNIKKKKNLKKET
jgi:hypothetical protein